ncbi:MAG: hypothetical protein Q4A32_06740 [Lachnospiraceae bacterium]|nr:hypothetical protein [Lachnospiraceae bacterium]
MVYNVNYNELAKGLNPIAFAKYLEDTGWSHFRTKRKDVRVFQKEKDKFYQVTIPMEDTLSDYNEALYQACKTVAECEDRPLEGLFLYLLNPNADILKIRIEKKNAVSGSILLDDAIGVYENAKRLLGAAAQDVIKPAAFHQGRMDSKITSFLSGCRFGQTEVGSYVVSVICPMTEMREGEFHQLELFEDEQEGETNFTRQVTTKVVKSIQKLKDRIDDGQYNLADTSTEDRISANFYEALLGINLEQEGTRIEFIPEWAPGHKMTEELPAKVSLSHRYYQPIHATVTKMKGSIKKNRKIVGRIKRLEATADVENREAGKVTVVYIDDNNRARTVIAKLEKDDYSRAIEAHAKGWYVEIVGEMSGRRASEVECQSFNVL